MTKRSRRSLALTAIAAVAMLSLLLQVPFAAADAISAGRIRLNRQKASLTSGVEFVVGFTTSGTNGTEAKVELRFPDADDGLWCRTAGTMTVTTSTEDSATELPGTLAGSCAQGSGASSYDTITVTGATDLATSTRYGFKVVADAGALGTPTTATTGVIRIATLTSGDAVIDSQNVAVDIISDDQVAVTATVDPTLTAALDANTAALGTLAASTINKAAIVSTVTTNAANGYTSHVLYANKLRIDVSNDIDDTAGGTIVAGTEEFGVASSDTSVDIATWSPAACATNSSTSNATALTTSAQSFATAAAPVSAEATTLCFLASITGTTPAGSYSTTATLVTTAKF